MIKGKETRTGLDGTLGIALQLYRDRSGSSVVDAPDEKWVSDMRHIDILGDAQIALMIRPTLEPGYDEKFGGEITFVPGTFEGGDGRTPADIHRLREPIDMNLFPHFAPSVGNFTVRTSLEGLIGLRDALNDIIANATMLSETAAAIRK